MSVPAVRQGAEQVQDLEIVGTSNRRSQGILAHTLHALKTRAVKTDADCRAQVTDSKASDLEDAVKKKEKNYMKEEMKQRALRTRSAQRRRLRDDLSISSGPRST
eukprot:3534972-Heterocapsa_arctica.AAC.1